MTSFEDIVRQDMENLRRKIPAPSLLSIFIDFVCALFSLAGMIGGLLYLIHFLGGPLYIIHFLSSWS